MFFTYAQINSGGVFERDDRVTEFVIIEADVINVDSWWSGIIADFDSVVGGSNPPESSKIMGGSTGVREGFIHPYSDRLSFSAGIVTQVAYQIRKGTNEYW